MTRTTLDRIDVYPTHEFAGYKLRPGKAFPFGATFVPGGVNFSVYSSHATACTLVLFRQGEREPLAEIPFPEEFRIGNVFSMTVFDLDYESVEYGFRMAGPFDPRAGHRFDPTKVLLDPYAKLVSGRDVWGAPPDRERPCPYRGRFVFDDFDWEGDRPLETPIEDLVIYEMHVRGFTRHASSGVRFPGTFAGVTEKIPYLKDLGVNCVELMPVYEFDEFEHSRPGPDGGGPLMNYWGYSTVGFFAPKAGYASAGKMGMQVDELKALVKELHRNRIEVILDVVFNHTSEGNELGPTVCFRGIDNKTYYMLTPDGHYFNFSGTGNTLNCNNPVVRSMVLDCLRYWVTDYHVDGFRFDLASVLGRDQRGAPLSNPPLLESLAHDPVLARTKLIAEAWDAGGLYQVGSFPAYGRWAEWNGKYRDCLRRFLRGEAAVGEVAQRLHGSPDLYGRRGATASVNFITCHDGFTLNDLVSYNQKRNDANGEENRDGANDNESWNCGAEGPTDDPAVNRLRRRQMKNAVAMLMISQGVPMILMGDEVGRSQSGNNNAYCHDGELTWLDWGLVGRNRDLFDFVKSCIAFRKAHPLLRDREAVVEPDGHPAVVSWHGTSAWHVDWSAHNRTLGLLLSGGPRRDGAGRGDHIYAAMNMHWEDHTFALPSLPAGLRWHLFADTSQPPPGDVTTPGCEPPLADQAHLRVGARSVVILVGR
jgi:glycogen operon protein